MFLARVIVPALLFLINVSAIPFFNPDYHANGDPIQFELVHSSHAELSRFKRSIDEEFPDFLHFNLDALNTTLRLRKSLRQNLRLLDLVEGCLTETKVTPAKETNVYEDPSNSGDFMVRRSTNGDFHVAGTFLHENKLRKVTPGSKKSRSRRNVLHIVSTIDFPINFGNDAITKIQAQFIQSQFPTLQHPNEKLVPEALEVDNRIREVNVDQLGTDHIVEIFVLTDYSDYQSFLKEAGTSRQAKSDMLVYYTFIEQTMNRYYESVNKVDNSFNIIVRFVSIYVPDTSSKAPYSEDVVQNGAVELSPIIQSYRNYFKNTQGVPQVDHWMGFTGYDMVNQGSSGVIGVAYIGGLCSKDLQVSVSENKITGLSGLIVAHELGHNLNSEHDSSQCNDNHIMAPSVVYPQTQSDTNPYYFSSCSVQAFKDYISSASGSCTKTIEDAGYTSYTEKHLGQIYKADKQCEYTRTSGSRFCRTGFKYGSGFDNMCWNFQCQAPGASSCFDVRIMDFTTCGNGKWCLQGKCVASSLAPAVLENCPQGDDPIETCERANCASYSSDKRTFSCCATCSAQVVSAATSATTSPTISTTTPPTTSPTTSPTISPTTPPTASPTTPPTISQTTPPTISPTTQPIASPTTPPTISPITQPIASPTTPPTTSPTTQTIASSTTPLTASPTISRTTPPTFSSTTPLTASPTTPPTTSATIPPVVSESQDVTAALGVVRYVNFICT
ncbi:hypothetical protein LOTGIDRAFT_236984 [Lottia gigantea]|uniref:Peptidase M12B domain-containing protein n=1 Tax=Lottia gigantea TaxID=225164 RepID=V4B2E1_LOTGI|nr:hypothetical protein LOTGIDRAFT_236984 [Lottia gigantea]ESO82509.1 hypothetical protein LOTGIDRAFT_236984 [Lottia gigantea]